MESLSVGGLASGLDTNAIIEGLTDLEMVKVRREEAKQQVVEDKLEAFNQLQGKVAEFSGIGEKLASLDAFNLYAASSSDEDIVTVEGDEDAIPGTYQVEVESLASSLKVTSRAFNSTVSAFGFSGSFEISKSKAAIEDDPTETTVEVLVNAGDTLKDVANQINSLEGAGVRASIISLGENDYRLVLSAVDEGTDGFFLQDTGGANILDAGGFDILNYQQSLRSDFNFRLNTIGAADTATLFSDLYTGLGVNAAVDAGDEINISGTDANGNAVAGTFTLGAASTIQDLLDEVQNVYQSAGATVNVSLNSSGEIVINDLSGGVQEMTMDLSFNDANASGSTMQLTPIGGQGNAQNYFNNILSEGKKAFFRVDGLSVSSDSNKADSIVTGTSFELHKASLGEVIEVSLERDDTKIQEKIQGFLDAYNAVIKFLDEKSKVEIKENEDDPNAKETVGKKGPFSSDSTILRLKSELRALVTEPINELAAKSKYTSLATIGITSSTTDGTLSIDEEKFKKALNTDFEGVRNLFVVHGYSDNPQHKMGRYDKYSNTGTYQIDADNNLMDSDPTTAGNSMQSASRLGVVLTGQTGDSKGLAVEAEAGSGTGSFTFIRGIGGKIQQYWKNANDGIDGYFKTTKTSIERQIDNYRERVEKLSDAADNFRARMIRQFADLENAMSRLQSQSASFQAQMGALG